MLKYFCLAYITAKVLSLTPHLYEYARHFARHTNINVPFKLVKEEVWIILHLFNTTHAWNIKS